MSEKDRLIATVNQWRNQIALSIIRKEELTERDIWSYPQGMIWNAKAFVGKPAFYPVYRYKDYYSYSAWFLILFKGKLVLNREFYEKRNQEKRPFSPTSETLDAEVVRIGGSQQGKPLFHSETKVVEAVASALVEDTSLVEERFKNYQHIILCGGKDSQNLLLLPWKTKVLALSASPNYELVKEFIRRNKLDIKIQSLEDSNTLTLEREILCNAGLNDLQHFRWTAELKQIADSFHGKAIFWKGQAGDLYMTPYWKTYSANTGKVFTKFRKIATRFLGWSQTRESLFEAAWNRLAMWQGTHMGFLRAATGALFLSAYHGEKMRSVLAGINYKKAIKRDLRKLIGNKLAGGEVWYPFANPAPPPTPFRREMHKPARFISLAKQCGISIKE